MAGRPTKIDETKAAQLAQLFSYGCTAREACALAGVGKSAFYARCQKDTKFAEYMRRQSVLPVLQARITVVKALGYNLRLAFQYLEKHDPEFRPLKHIAPNKRPAPREEPVEVKELRKSTAELKATLDAWYANAKKPTNVSTLRPSQPPVLQ